ncbi:MAG: DNA repair protein RecO [Gammaproteobacteria bacterium]|jgi:DNA repair protein RecO (recombination protein O)|uniref:DNA repair protein RecO n=1 Tax=SAR86 cluster bacterium TaxID=2030880 RepID=A0A520N1C1_9GAMM|nr:DNA repair protein RecO [SAR86 cluster bacterium]RZO27233.1 MAG: DNA repair protein RecO [SAR86 cluster bacterium]|tara:strand:+ start:5623 stop:6300 length:678 start_codon:yes stop_codon:yes gene_type:complete
MVLNLQEAFVIHSKPYKETSLLVTFFGSVDGKISAIAKGAKRPKSRFSGNLEPFQLLQINFTGRSELKTLTSVDTVNAYQDFRSNKNLYSAFYINELISLMVKSNEDPTQLFLIYKNSLNEIKGTESIEICLRKFELNLLTVLGYEINFSTEYKTGEKILPEKNYIYTPESGFVENQTGYKGLQLLNISNKRFSTESLAVAKKINQQTLEYYFDELNINSRLFFK